MRAFWGSKLALCLAAALILAGCVSVCQAQSGPKTDKHGQKIEKRLSRYKTGTLLLADTSFTFNNSETNAKETHLYSDVSRVEKGKEYIGAGSTPKHHIIF